MIRFAVITVLLTASLAHAFRPGSTAYVARWIGESGGAENIYLELGASALFVPSYTGTNTDVIASIVATNNGDTVATSNGWELDGTGDYLDLGFAPEFEPQTNSFTMSAWVWVRSFNVANIIGKTLAGGGERWTLGITASGFRIVIQDPSDAIYFANYTAVSTGQWYHAAFVIDRTVPEVILYVNGSVVDRDTIGLAGAPNGLYYADAPAHVTMRVGVYNDSAGNPTANFFNGYIDHVAAWQTTAVTSNDIKRIYDYGRNYP